MYAIRQHKQYNLWQWALQFPRCVRAGAKPTTCFMWRGSRVLLTRVRWTNSPTQTCSPCCHTSKANINHEWINCAVVCRELSEYGLILLPHHAINSSFAAECREPDQPNERWIVLLGSEQMIEEHCQHRASRGWGKDQWLIGWGSIIWISWVMVVDRAIPQAGWGYGPQEI